ncbi:MAG TPA: extracellular solute-binding protein [Alphaproteobacteria bacterium]|nr:extracellular solute-binding protein [Alphaproteobacteria bacterium]
MRQLLGQRLFVLAAFALAAAASGGYAQEAARVVSPPGDADRSWIEPSLLAAARQEGSVTIFASVNEEEALPLWAIFERETGLKAEYVRGSDSQLIARILVEARAGKQTWDILQNTGVSKIPREFLAPIDLPEARFAAFDTRGPNGLWHGVAANFGVPAYNTRLVDRAVLPKTYAEFLKHPEWAGRIAIDDSDGEWLAALYKHFGETEGATLARDLASALKPVMVQGHLALARSVGSGEYALALNNTLNLTANLKLGGAPTDFWVLDPVVVYYNHLGVSAKAPHPNAARLAANFLLSEPAQRQLASKGRIPTRRGIETNPPGLIAALDGKTIIPIQFDADEESRWRRLFRDVMRGPPR